MWFGAVPDIEHPFLADLRNFGLYGLGPSYVVWGWQTFGCQFLPLGAFPFPQFLIIAPDKRVSLVLLWLFICGLGRSRRLAKGALRRLGKS
jgi:hypothetical protein